MPPVCKSALNRDKSEIYQKFLLKEAEYNRTLGEFDGMYPRRDAVWAAERERDQAKAEWLLESKTLDIKRDFDKQLKIMSKTAESHHDDGEFDAEKAALDLHDTLETHVNTYFTALHEHAKTLWQDKAHLKTINQQIDKLQLVRRSMTSNSWQRDTSEVIYIADNSGILHKTTVRANELQNITRQISSLEETKNQLIQNSSSKEKTIRDIFKKNYSGALDTARKVLEQHRGWGALLKTLGLLLSGIGTLPAIVNIGYRVVTGNYLFFQNSEAPMLNGVEKSFEDLVGTCSYNHS